MVLARWLNNLLAILLLAGAWGLRAQPPAVLNPPPGRLSLKVYGPEQGLANPVVWSMVQDGQGFLWAGTEDGLFRYDGARFHGWTMKDGLPASLVEHLCFDETGTLWVGTYAGLAAKTPEGVRAVGPESGLPATRIMGLGVGMGGRLWVATKEGPFWRTAEGRFQAVPGWPGGTPTALAVSKTHSRAWMGHTHQGRHGLRAWEDGTWKDVELEPRLQEPVGALAQGKDGTLWIRSLSRLWSLGSGSHQGKDAHPTLPPVHQQPSLYVDPRGRLWVPTARGVSRFDGTTWDELTEQVGFTPKVIHSMLFDQEGSLWIGGNDLYRVLGGGIFRHYNRSHGLPSEIVWCSLRDATGRLVVGTDSGLCVATPTGFSVVPGTQGFQVRSAALGPDGAIYATGHAAVLRWDPRGGSAQRFGPESGFQPEGRVFRLRFAPDGTLWIATEGAGLLRAKPEAGRLRFHPEEVTGGNPRERFTDIWVDAQQRMWAAGSGGLAVKEGGTWRRFTKDHGLKNNNAAFVRSLHDGTILLAYFAAPNLTQIRYDQGRFQILRHFDGIFPADKVIYFFGEDARRGLWLGTGQGVYLLLPDGRLEHFGRNEGLASENTSNMSFFAEPDGTVWFGTTAGLHRFDATLYTGAPQPPRTAFLEVRFGSQRVPGGLLGPMALKASQSTVEVQFAAPSSIREGKVEYLVRLVGFENDWHPSPNREERYPKLPPGRYTFEAKARIGLGAYGPAMPWSFEVLPAWYQTWWFRSLVVLGTAGVIMGLVRIRLRALSRRNRMLEEVVAARTLQLQEAIDQLRNQSLTDPLTGLRNRRYLGVCLPEDLAQVQRRHFDLKRQRSERMALNIDMLFLMVDLDHFKSVNDEYGHHAGDQVLQQVADLIRRATRNTDTVVRWGGEEFLVVGRNTCRKEASILAERIRTFVAGHTFDLGNGQTLRRTCSVGFAFFPLAIDHPDDLSWETVVSLADRCMYAAKRSGRNAWVGILAGENLDNENLSMRLQVHLEAFISSGQLKLLTSLPEGARLDWNLHD